MMVKATGAGHTDVGFNMIFILLSENGWHKVVNNNQFELTHF